MNIYSCFKCARILTEWEIQRKKSNCSCGSTLFNAANPTTWYLIRTLQFIRIYFHLILFNYCERKYSKI